jgi:rhamnosyl/mannosyltransferase
METILELVCERTAGQVENRVIVANAGIATKEEHVGSVEVVRAGAIARIGAVAICPTMPWRLAREQPDLVVIHEPNPMGLVAYYLARPEARLVVWFHSEVIRPSWRYRLFYRPFLQFALSRASKIVVASPTLAASAPQLREWRSKCTVIPYGVDTRALPDATARRAHDMRKAAGRPVVLFVGRLVPYKGADVLLDALCGLDAVAMIVGDGPQRAPLANRARALGISDRVRFLGSVGNDDLRALYAACDLFVLPSVTRQEAFGVVQIEAMAHGKPVISTDLGTGTAWVNQHGETGLVVPPGDAAALHAAIGELLADPGRRADLGRAAARRARTMFHVDRMIDATLELYRDVMHGPASHVA